MERDLFFAGLSPSLCRAAGTNGNAVDELDAYLAATLRRARRFHQALDSVENSNSPVVLLAIGGDCEETLNSPVILRDEKRNRWVTLTRPREYRTSTGSEDFEEASHRSDVRARRRPCHAFLSARRESLQSPRRSQALRSLVTPSSAAISTATTTQQNSAGQRPHRNRRRSRSLKTQSTDYTMIYVKQICVICVIFLRIDQRVELLGPVGVDVCEDCVLLERGVAVAHGEERFAEIVVGFAVIRLQTD